MRCRVGRKIGVVHKLTPGPLPARLAGTGDWQPNAGTTPGPRLVKREKTPVGMTRAHQPQVLWGLFLAVKLIHLPDELAGVGREAVNWLAVKLILPLLMGQALRGSCGIVLDSCAPFA